MVAYCNAVWRCRYFWLSLVQMDLRNRYRGSVLGMGWSLVFPLCMTAIFTTVFCRLFHQQPAYYAPYVLTGLACWAFFLQTALNGCLCFYTAEQYIRQHITMGDVAEINAKQTAKQRKIKLGKHTPYRSEDQCTR